MALVRDEYIIRKTSTSVVQTVMNTIRSTYLDKKQVDPTNKNASGGYINFYFGDLFDSRDGSLYRIWSTAATNDPAVIAGNATNGDSFYTIINVASIKSALTTTLSGSFLTTANADTNFLKKADATATYLTLSGAAQEYLAQDDANATYALKSELPDLTDYRIEDEIIQIVDGKINQIKIDEVIIG